MATEQYGAAMRQILAQAYVDGWGAAPKFRVLDGSMPASCAAAEVGTRLLTFTLPTTPLAASGGAASLLGLWTGTVATNGTARYYRVLLNDESAVVAQGTITRAFPLVTTAATSAGNNVLTFADTTGISAGMALSGTGIPTGATALSVGPTSVTMDAISTAGVSSGTTVYCGDTSGRMWLLNTALTAGQAFTVPVWVRNAPGA